MSLLFGKKDITIDRRQSLDGVPVLNDGAIVSTEADGRVLIRIPAGKARGLVSRLLPALPESRIRLDELGSFVLGQVDGRRSVMQIVRAFTEKYRVNLREAELSVAEFLKTLTRKRVVSIVIR
jgi:hypothetical protein